MSLRRKPTPARGALTDHVITALVGLLEPTVLVGDHLPPEGGGWPEGQPGTGSFKPYVVISVGPGQPGIPGGPPDDEDVWRLTYSAAANGTPRTMADAVSDRVRDYFESLGGATVTLGSVDWRILRVRTKSLGGIQLNRSVDPPWLEVVDQMELTLSRA